jgi:hypothetical protein
MKAGKIFFILILLASVKLRAQDDLIGLVDNERPAKEIVKNAFKSSRVINSQSMELIAKGTMDFRILHRFGQVNQGYQNFFGLDQASMRIGFDFGILTNLSAGVGRSTYRKELDGFIKYAVVRQSTGHHSFPASLVFISGITMNTSPWAHPEITNYFTSRLSYQFQLIMGRKFNDKLTVQLNPMLVHLNIVPLQTQPNDNYSIGLGGRYKITKRMALTWDYFYRINGRLKGETYDPASVGIDIETGGHVFQLHFSNCVGMNERAFIMETTNKWYKGEIRFGFNLSRLFQIWK